MQAVLILHHTRRITLEDTRRTAYEGGASPRKQRVVRICQITDGLSADLCGLLTLGDELLEVDEHKVEDLSVTQIDELIHGQRGSFVVLTLSRVTGRTEKQGLSSPFRIALRRGAWGPEYAVVAPEVCACVRVRQNVCSGVYMCARARV